MKPHLKASQSADHAARPGSLARRNASVAAPSRRDFVRWLAAGLCLRFALDEEALAEAASGSQALLAQAVHSKPGGDGRVSAFVAATGIQEPRGMEAESARQAAGAAALLACPVR